MENNPVQEVVHQRRWRNVEEKFTSLGKEHQLRMRSVSIGTGFPTEHLTFSGLRDVLLSRSIGGRCCYICTRRNMFAGICQKKQLHFRLFRKASDVLYVVQAWLVESVILFGELFSRRSPTSWSHVISLWARQVKSSQREMNSISHLIKPKARDYSGFLLSLTIPPQFVFGITTKRAKEILQMTSLTG